MRAGCFAEDRVIELVNRRFVPFYYCTGGPGLGHDNDAKAFVGKKTGNQWAFLAVFDVDGQLLGESAIYADKNAAYDFLQGILRSNPAVDRMTATDAVAVAAAEARGAALVDRLRAGDIFEKVGRYDEATRLYSEIRASSVEVPTHVLADALLGLLRIYRYEQAWPLHSAVEAELRAIAVKESSRLLADADAEAGYRLIAARKYAEGRRVLQHRAQAETRGAQPSRRLAELHFNAGIACWYLGDRDWAKFHWCWVAENMPEDRLCRRAYIAAASEAMPYPNAEIGGFRADRDVCSIEDIERAYQDAHLRHKALRASFLAGRLTAAAAAEVEATERESDPERLVRCLRDGNAHVAENNRIVERLVALGSKSIGPALRAHSDPGFRGRGFALWAAATVARSTGRKSKEVLSAVSSASAMRDPFIRAIAASCRRILEQ